MDMAIGVRDNVVYWKTKWKIKNDLQCEAIGVYKYGRGGNYAYICRHTQAENRERKIQMSRDDTNRNRVFRTSIGTVT